MKELVKFELKKIFSNKVVYIAAIVILILEVIMPIYNIIQDEKKLGSREEVESMAETYMNGDYSRADINSIVRQIYNSGENFNEMSKEKRFIAFFSDSFSVDDQKAMDKHLDEITTKLNGLNVESMDDSYEYNSLSKQKEMIEKLPHQESAFLGDWSRVLDFDRAAPLKIILLVVGLAGIFSKEYSNRVSYINLSTRNGKDKLNRAKIIAALIYTTIVFAVVTISYVAKTFYLGLPNGDKPLSCMMNSLYNISINKYYLYTLAISYFGTLIFAMGIIVLSLLTKNIVLECGIPIFLYIIPTIFRIGDFYDYIDLSVIFKGRDLLGSFQTMNIFGNAVLYPYEIISFGAIVFIVMILIYRRLGRNQTIA